MRSRRRSGDRDMSREGERGTLVAMIPLTCTGPTDRARGADRGRARRVPPPRRLDRGPEEAERGGRFFPSQISPSQSGCPLLLPRLSPPPLPVLPLRFPLVRLGVLRRDDRLANEALSRRVEALSRDKSRLVDAPGPPPLGTPRLAAVAVAVAVAAVVAAVSFGAAAVSEMRDSGTSTPMRVRIERQSPPSSGYAGTDACDKSGRAAAATAAAPAAEPVVVASRETEDEEEDEDEDEEEEEEDDDEDDAAAAVVDRVAVEVR